MLALVLTGVGILVSIGLGTSLVVLFAVATALTLLPALLTLLGNRIDAGRVVGRRRPVKQAEDTAWWRLRPPRLAPAVAVPGRRLGRAAHPGRPGTEPEDRLPGRRRQPDDPVGPARLRPAGRGLRTRLQLPAADRRRPARAPVSTTGRSPRCPSASPPTPASPTVGDAAGLSRTATPSCCPRSSPPGARTQPPPRPWTGCGPSPPTGST